LCGDDPEVERDTWGAGDSYYGDRVGGEGVGDCKGGRPSTKAHIINNVTAPARRSA
jgi:hypothetical protein